VISCRLLFPSLLAAVLTAAEPSPDAVALYEQKHYPEAQVAFERRVAADSRDAEAWFYLGRLALGRQRPDEAIPPFEKAATLVPAEAEYQFQYGAACLQQAGQLGMSFKALGLVRKGRAAMEKAVELAPANVTYRQGLLEFYAQAPGLAGGGLDKAYAQAEAMRPHDPRAAVLAVVGLKVREKKYADAFAALETLVRDQPDDYQALYLIGRTAAESGQELERGAAALRTCLGLAPPPYAVGHASVNFRLGQILAKSGDLAGARAAFEAALKLEPTHTGARTALERL